MRLGIPLWRHLIAPKKKLRNKVGFKNFSPETVGTQNDPQQIDPPNIDDPLEGLNLEEAAEFVAAAEAEKTAKKADRNARRNANRKESRVKGAVKKAVTSAKKAVSKATSKKK